MSSKTATPPAANSVMLTGIIINIIYSLTFILIGCQMTSAVDSGLNNYKLVYPIARNCRRIQSSVIIDALEHRLLDFEGAVTIQSSLCGIFGEQSCIGTSFFSPVRLILFYHHLYDASYTCYRP
jgi:hypothetical protein